MRNVCLRTLTLALAAMSLMCGTTNSSAQTVTTVMEFDQFWRYDQTGRQLPSTWNTLGFIEDGSWAGPGRGLLGVDNNTPLVYPIHLTPLSLSLSLTNYYLRSGFNFSGQLGANITRHMTLIASNYVDDGAVIFLNGSEVGRVRVPAGQNAATYATSGTEGVLEPFVFRNPTMLLNGTNVVAVELHQVTNSATDITWGMKLMIVSNTPIVFTQQPLSQAASVGDDVVLSVAVSGGPAFYQWQSNGVNIVGATNGSPFIGSPTSTLSLSNITLATAAQYRVVATNTHGTVISAAATLTVTEDTLGPRLVSAIIDNPALGNSIPNRSNTINLIFNESVLNTTGIDGVRHLNNYQVVSSANPAIRIGISNVLYNTTFNAILYPSNTVNWSPTNRYYLIVNNVSDTKGNRINPNSVIAVSQVVVTNLTQMSDSWLYYDSSFIDPTFPAIYTNNTWFLTNFVPNLNYWATGNGIFFAESGPAPEPCFGDVFNTQITWQFSPTLFRRVFVAPTNSSSSGTFRLRYLVDDGMVLYLNGQEIYRTNINQVPVTHETRALSVVEGAVCTNVVLEINNLRPGTNWLAAAVVQHATHQVDTVFGVEMDLVALATHPAPINVMTNPVITVQSRNATNFVLSWPATNYGWALVYTTNITWPNNFQGNGARHWKTNRANWLQVKDQSNPYTNRIPPNTGPRRFYQLFREPLSGPLRDE